jgi:hypothetical protein
MNALSHLIDLPETQSEIKNFAEMLVSEIEIRQALPLLARLTALEKLCKTAKDLLKDQLLEEASLYAGEKTFEINGVKYTKTDRTTYHYHNCPKWVELDKQIKELEATMKVIKEPMADTETGEIIFPALQSGSESISVTLRK